MPKYYFLNLCYGLCFSMKATEINTGDGTPVHDAFVCGSGADPGDNVSDGCCDVLIIDGSIHGIKEMIESH